MYEHEILSTLQENPRIKVYTVEFLENEESTPNLERLSVVSGGRHARIVHPEDVEAKLSPLVSEIARACMTVQPPQAEKNNFREVNGILIWNS